MSRISHIITNSISNSTAKVAVKTITFAELWKNYPSTDSVRHDAENISDYCAIKVSEALIRSGVIINKRTFNGVLCWGCPGESNHIIRAQELANWLKLKPFVGCPNAQTLTGEGFRDALQDKTGIVFFKDYWLRSNEQARTGDHIDLWNGRGLDRMASLRRTGGNLLFNTFEVSIDGWHSDKELSKEVLFWEIK
jgi:hypothetical protein